MMEITSEAFRNNQPISAKYSCEGEDVNPPLQFHNVPKDAKTLALIMDDPDAPVGNWDHWILWNIAPNAAIEENSVPLGAEQGKNSWSRNDYGGPCPPSGTHRYFFKLYALDTKLDLDSRAGKRELEAAMEGHILEKAELIGLFSKE